MINCFLQGKTSTLGHLSGARFEYSRPSHLRGTDSKCVGDMPDCAPQICRILALASTSDKQGSGAETVDQEREASGVFVDARQSVISKQGASFVFGKLNTLMDIGDGLCEVESGHFVVGPPFPSHKNADVQALFTPYDL